MNYHFQKNSIKKYFFIFRYPQIEWVYVIWMTKIESNS
jgi:hypothetical protein